MADSIVNVLMEREGLTKKEAESELLYDREELNTRLEQGKDASNICEEYFGLEPDYLDELIT